MLLNISSKEKWNKNKIELRDGIKKKKKIVMNIFVLLDIIEIKFV